MAEPLKNGLGPDVVEMVAIMIQRVYPAFPASTFMDKTLDGYEALGLTERGQRMADALRVTLPEDPEIAIKIITSSLGPEDEGDTLKGMQPFRYLPFTLFVSDYGLGCYETSMTAMYELTKRFTAEQCIRTFIVNEPERTMARLIKWTSDPSPHVRRLVSEGTRPRLPWAERLRAFQKDPAPVLELLELLKDDPSEYVRRSVANNLNDISKDHPGIAIDTCTRWALDAPTERKKLIRHAMRGLVKQGEPGALALLGARHGTDVNVRNGNVRPASLAIGESLEISFDVVNTGIDTERLVIDFRVHYVKANGDTSAKVFKAVTVDLAPGEGRSITRRLSLQQLTTRKHYPGRHVVEALVNGSAYAVGWFDLESQ